MEAKPTDGDWHVARNGNDFQGLIVSESGRNVAVTYDKDDAPVMAQSKNLLASLEGILGLIRYAYSDGAGLVGDNLEEYESKWLPMAEAAIAKAKEA